jgi:hypothetical protein
VAVREELRVKGHILEKVLRLGDHVERLDRWCLPSFAAQYDILWYHRLPFTFVALTLHGLIHHANHADRLHTASHRDQTDHRIKVINEYLPR